jgi:hypothetical protein
MKYTIVLFCLLASASCSNAQKVSNKLIPPVVKTAFQQQFPNAKEIKWDKEDGNYEASFEMADADQSVLIDASENVLETEIEIKIAELPINTRAYIAKNYAGKKIKEAAKITDNKSIVTFEAEIKGKDLIFDINGNFIKEVNN